MRIKDLLEILITHYSRVYNIGYGKINKKRREQKLLMKCRLMNKHTQVALVNIMKTYRQLQIFMKYQI